MGLKVGQLGQLDASRLTSPLAPFLPCLTLVGKRGPRKRVGQGQRACLPQTAEAVTAADFTSLYE
jgi:hypothetical protein